MDVALDGLPQVATAAILSGMPDDIPATHDQALLEVRELLAAIAREAGRRSLDDIVDLAGRADERVSRLLPQARRTE